MQRKWRPVEMASKGRCRPAERATRGGGHAVLNRLGGRPVSQVWPGWSAVQPSTRPVAVWGVEARVHQVTQGGALPHGWDVHQLVEQVGLLAGVLQLGLDVLDVLLGGGQLVLGLGELLGGLLEGQLLLGEQHPGLPLGHALEGCVGVPGLVAGGVREGAGVHHLGYYLVTHPILKLLSIRESRPHDQPHHTLQRDQDGLASSGKQPLGFTESGTMPPHGVTGVLIPEGRRHIDRHEP